MAKYHSFRTVRKSHAVILRQPFIWTKRDRNGKIKEQIKCQYNEDQTTLVMADQVSPDPNRPVEPTPVYIMRGVKNISEEADEALLLQMFQIHPDNVDNGGKVFKHYDVQKEELLQLEAFEKADNAKELLRKADDNLVRAAAVWFLGNKYLSSDISTNKMKLQLRQSIDLNVEVPGSNGQDFVDAFTSFMKDKGNDEKLLAALALEKNILEIVAGRKLVWTASGEPCYVGSQASEVVKEFATWLKNDKEGRDVAKQISEKLK